MRQVQGLKQLLQQPRQALGLCWAGIQRGSGPKAQLGSAAVAMAVLRAVASSAAIVMRAWL